MNLQPTTPVPRGDIQVPYTRYLICIRCDQRIDARYKQLEVKDGFRIISCPGCKWRGRSQHLKCECGINWLLCNQHRADPPTHQSNKPPRRTTRGKKKADKVLLSNRTAPLIKGTDMADKRRTRKGTEEESTHSSYRSCPWPQS